MADTLPEPPAPTWAPEKPPTPLAPSEPSTTQFNTSRLPADTAQPFVESPHVERQSPALPYRPRLPRSQLSEIVLHEGPRRHSSRSAIGPWCVPAWWKRLFVGLHEDPLDCTTEKNGGGRWEFKASQRALRIIRLTLVSMIFGGIVAGWIVFDLKAVARAPQKTGDSATDAANAWSAGSILLVNVAFILATLASLVALYHLVRPLLGEYLPWFRHKEADEEPTIPAEEAPQPRLPSYVFAVGGEGAGTGDVEDRYIVGETPPAYGEGKVRGASRCSRPPLICSFQSSTLLMTARPEQGGERAASLESIQESPSEEPAQADAVAPSEADIAEAATVILEVEQRSST